MASRTLFLVSAVLLSTLKPSVCAASGGSNAAVLNAAKEIIDGGGYNAQWKGSGTTREITFKQKRILSKGDGTYCSGFTFTVVMDAMEKLGLSNNKTVGQIRAFQKKWYGNSEDQTIREKQAQVAIVDLGVGEAVKPADARPGDFVQFWRSTTGHSAVFLGWVEEENEQTGEMQTTGLRYRSSQGSTQGVGNAEERFRRFGGSVDEQRMYFSRLHEAIDLN